MFENVWISLWGQAIRCLKRRLYVGLVFNFTATFAIKNRGMNKLSSF
jgi:hypothetical protein